MPEQMSACPEWFGIPHNGTLGGKEIPPPPPRDFSVSSIKAIIKQAYLQVYFTITRSTFIYI